jgi:ADP-ribosylglycohydrolase
MRVAPLGAYYADDLRKAAAEAVLSAEVTHTHPEGVAGAVATAVAAALAAGEPHVRGADYAEAFWATASVGGDIDTACAIVGGITAARLGNAGIPAEWMRRCEPLPAWSDAAQRA